MNQINLEYKMKEGQTYLYDVYITNTKIFREAEREEKETDQIKLKLSQKVTKVLPNQVYELEVEIEPISFLRNSNPQEIPIPTQTMKMTMDKKGKVLASTMESPVNSPTFPYKPVSIGETWVSPAELKLQEGSSIKLNYYYTVKGMEKYKNYDTVLIEVNSDEWSNTMQDVNQYLKSTGITLFSVEYGALMKSKVETEVKASIQSANQEFISIVEVIVELDKLLQKDVTETEEGFIIK
ncbi:MAG: hypothetical protein RMJ51_05865 [Candidatus Calescibacterium sp.]|nr:hypothetical protein [Candidatus Calescibacterium sp.]MCX7972365.1 hypothetical protein [bacterium]MDW8195744.1 hypothetical protein [Candidatus Calescibacterium sp.]